MKRRWKITIAVLVAFIVIVELSDRYFIAEAMAVEWHLTHGFHTRLGSYRFEVPFSYYASDPDGTGSLNLTKLPGRLHRGWADIDIDFVRQPPPDQLRSEALERTMMRVHMTKTGERSVTLAGKPGTCVEYKHDKSPATEMEQLLYMSGVTIFCSFVEERGNIGVKFLGTTEATGEFYEFIRAAEFKERSRRN